VAHSAFITIPGIIAGSTLGLAVEAGIIGASLAFGAAIVVAGVVSVTMNTAYNHVPWIRDSVDWWGDRFNELGEVFQAVVSGLQNSQATDQNTVGIALNSKLVNWNGCFTC
jgi:hypothetical protein